MEFHIVWRVVALFTAISSLWSFEKSCSWPLLLEEKLYEDLRFIYIREPWTKTVECTFSLIVGVHYECTLLLYADIQLLRAGVRRYGKNYRAIAEVIGNKNESLVRSFFVTYRRRFKLDEVLAEYEKEHGVEVKPQREEVRCLWFSYGQPWLTMLLVKCTNFILLDVAL